MKKYAYRTQYKDMCGFKLTCVRCFKETWKVGKVGKVGEVGKLGRKGLFMPTWSQL
jgi:hypothetical protein